MTVLSIDHVASPLGMVTIVVADDAVCGLAFSVARSRMLARTLCRFPGLMLRRCRDPNQYSTRVRAYFSGEFDALDDIAVDCGGTTFEERVWASVRAVPAGTTRTYRDVAELIRHPQAIRAVGRANARNPVCLVIPCHRMIGSDGQLRGYAGGIWRKRWLLEHERAASPLKRRARAR